MPANGRRDLIRRLKVKENKNIQSYVTYTDWFWEYEIWYALGNEYICKLRTKECL